MFNPKYKLTTNIVKMLVAIAEAKTIIEQAKILPKQELRLRRQAMVRMTHSSTAIEGNRLEIPEVEAVLARKKISAPDRDIFEVQNYLNVLRYIEKIVQEKRQITEKVLLKIHRMVTCKTLPGESSGRYRPKPVFVVRRRWGSPDEIVYTGPDARKVPVLCASLIKWTQNSEREGINPVITAGIVHQEIAAIHPFNDGNGRTARALATLVLYSRGYDFRHLFALEDYYNRDRQKYYQAINIGKNYNERQHDFTSWLEYFTRGFREEIDNVREKVNALSSKKIKRDISSKIYLDKDQLQILDFMDQVGRITAKDTADILECPKRTAQLQLQKLKRLGIIKQVGRGPASAYIAKSI
ncbi:MAG: Fic family protein [Candidatus Margulisbacteria bacterium]|nr:Fic family protein [Candidatus Margulisiibacteriota bacterium]